MKRKAENSMEPIVSSKSQKRKKIYEAAKSVLICVLCVSSIYMAYKVIDMHSNSGVMESSFWFTGSDPERVMSSELTTENILKTFLDYSKPELVIVNRGENRGELKMGHDGYDRTMDFINKVMQSIHSAGAEYSKVSSDAVRKNLMMANSIYIKYPYARLSEMDARFFQIKDSSFAKNAATYSEAFLLPDIASERVVVFVISKDNPEEMLRIQTESFAATLSEIINDLEYINTKEYAFAAELNLDKTGEDGNGSSTTLDSMIAIPLNTKITNSVLCDVPWEYANALKFTQTTDFSAGFMDIFNYNPNTIRQYAAKDGTLTFVSGKGTLSMHPDGVLEYKALDQSEGIMFSSGANMRSDDLYTSAAGVIKIVKKILNLCYSSFLDEKTDIRFTRITKQTDGDIHFCLDYFVNGYRVKMKNGCAIDAKVHSGMLTEMKMHIATFKVLDKETENKSLINAIDDFFANGRQNKKVADAGLVYELSGEGNEMITRWEIRGEQEE